MDKEVKEILYKYLGKEKDEPIHGIPHAERVFGYYKLFVKGNSVINLEIKKALEYAVLLHDVGRSCPIKGRGDEHGVESVKIIKECVRKGLLKEMPKKDWVYFQVSKGSTNKLAHLCL